MIKKDLEFVKKLLERIKPQDEQVLKALSFINRDLAIFESRRGQLKDQYESDWGGF
jgi:hypothetical protein